MTKPTKIPISPIRQKATKMIIGKLFFFSAVETTRDKAGYFE